MHSIRTSIEIAVALARVTLLSLYVAMIVGPARAESGLEPCPEETSVPWTDCFGTYAYGNGTKYVGEFRNDARNGKGIFTYPDGANYVGEFADNEKQGQGTFTWPNGAKYVGTFAEGIPNGNGTEYGPDGSQVRTGLWEKGEFVGDADSASNE